MPKFILDTQGQVEPPQGVPLMWPHPLRWDQLSAFAQGYIEALFFTETEAGTVADPDDATAHCSVWNPETDSSLPGDVSFADLAPDTLLSILKDCEAFQAKGAELLRLAYERDYDEAQAGRDFWYTRNGHGVGFWTREQLEPDSEEYERLTAKIIASRDDNKAWDAAVTERNALKVQGLGQRLSDLAKEFGEVWTTYGDDGKVHVQ